MCEVIYVVNDDIDDIANDVIIALGEFDSIHLGHQELLKTVKHLSDKHQYKSAMMAFAMAPDYVLNKRKYEGNLTSIEEKARVLSMMGIDYLLVFDFESICRLSPDEFYDDYLSKFKGVVCGFDYKFGFKGAGDSSYLKDRFEMCEIVDQVLFYGRKVGSSEIREYLSRGNLSLVNELLGRPYSVSAMVYEVGDDALCELDMECYFPRSGTYKCEYFINEYESFVCFSIIEETVLKLLGVNNVTEGDTVRVQLLEYIEESGV